MCYSHVTLMNHHNQLYIPYLWQYCLRMHCHPSLFIIYLLMCFLSFFLSFISVHGFLFVRCLLDESMDIKFLFIRCIYLYFYSYPIVSFRLVLVTCDVQYSRSVFDMYLTFTTPCTVQSYVNVYAIRLFLEKVYQISILFKSTSVYFPILIAL